MAVVKIVIMSVVAACLYGIAMDQITARVCIEYFTIGHPKIFNTQDPTILALGWGIIATWWVGLPLGLLIAISARAGKQPRWGWRDLVRPLLVLLCIMGAVSAMAGLAGYLAAQAGMVGLLGPLAHSVPADRHTAFLADLWAHIAAYASGAASGIGLCVWCLIVRNRRRAIANLIPPARA